LRPCEEYEDLISAFIDGVLPEADRERLMEHMASCPACQAYFDDQVAIHDAFVRGEAPAPERLASAVMAQVCSTPQRAKRKPILLRWQSYAALAACCALAVLGLWSFRNAQGNQKAAQDAVAACVPYAAPDGADIPEALNGSEAGTVPEESPKLRMANDDTPPQPEPQEAAKPENDAPSVAPAAAPPAPGPSPPAGVRSGQSAPPLRQRSAAPSGPAAAARSPGACPTPAARTGQSAEIHRISPPYPRTCRCSPHPGTR